MNRRELKVGEQMKDNDPRMYGRVTIIEVLPNGVSAKDQLGRVRLYLRKHIYTDGRPRRSGFSVIDGEQA